MKYFKDKVILSTVILNVLMQAGAWWLLINKINPNTDPVFLHYNIYFGIDYLGEWYKVFWMPASGLCFYLLNFIFSYIIYSKHRPLSYLFVILATIYQSIFMVAAVLIILINL